MAALRLGELVRVDQTLLRVLAQHFEHRDARFGFGILAEPNHVLLDQRREPEQDRTLVALVGRHGCGRVERAAAMEHAEPAKAALLRIGEQIVTPRDRRVHRLLPLRPVGCAVAEQRQAPLEPRCERFGRQQQQARRGELDCER